MKFEYTKLFSFILGITFILSGVIFALTNEYKENKQNMINEENQIIDEILDVYEVFKKKTEEFSTKRDNINEDISEYTSYYTGMPVKYDEMIKELNQYETLVTEVEDTAMYLKNHCLNDNYSNSDANSKCNAYIINYEKTVNSFIGDIEFFNSKIEEYNNWILEENKELSEKEKYQALEKFTPQKHKIYIDVNGDGTYLGRASD